MDDYYHNERVLYVNFNWNRDDSKWNVNSNEVNTDRWNAGNRVFLATYNYFSSLL